MAREAALAWLLMGVTSASIGVISVRRVFLVRDDAAATARNILQAETLFRAAIASELLSQTIFLFLALTFYKLLKDVERDWARAMVALVGVGAAVGFANCLNLVMPLVLLRGHALVGFTPAQLEQLAYAFLRLREFGFTIVTWFLTQPSGAFGELPLLLWLLIKGADATRTTAPPPEASATS